jgi:23S rRNA pseudouridine1911/1915/1917 synthase
LVGDRKYSTNEDGCEIALWSHRLAFYHPVTGEKMEFIHEPPEEFPWSVF